MTHHGKIRSTLLKAFKTSNDILLSETVFTGDSKTEKFLDCSDCLLGGPLSLSDAG